MANVLAMVQADCILQSENFSSLFTLGYVTHRHWVRVYVLFWVLINVVSNGNPLPFSLTRFIGSDSTKCESGIRLRK